MGGKSDENVYISLAAIGLVDAPQEIRGTSSVSQKILEQLVVSSIRRHWVAPHDG